MSEISLDRHEISFEQAEGVEPLPQQMALKTVSRVLAARLYDALYGLMKDRVNMSSNVEGVWASIMKRHFVNRLGGFTDEFSPNIVTLSVRMKQIYSSDNYVEIFGTTEWLVRNSNATPYPHLVERILKEERAAYRLVDKHDIVPLVSEEEGQAFIGALAVLSDRNLQGARTHLKAAGRAITAAEYANSVRESIHAIESASRSLSPSAKFSDALSQIEASQGLHPALKRGLLALYGYTSDEQGIRHPLLDNGDASVREQDAILMLGICSAAVTYLVNKR